MDRYCSFFTVTFEMPAAVAISQWMDVVGWRWPISAMISCMMRASFTFRKHSPTYSSDTGNATNLRMVHIV